MKARSATVDLEDIARFSKDSGRWWDETGPFAPLHRLNPARMEYLKTTLCAHAGRDPQSLNSLKNLSVLDIGCGGGLACEPLARLGATVTGIDADGNAIQTAAAHAKTGGLRIDYRCAAIEDLGRETFDAVLALEIVEHVSDPAAFVAQAVAHCKPGGLVIFSTLNKTLKSLALGKVAAEYILRWVPAGTHDWRKFIRPSTLAASLRAAGAEPFEVKGLIFNPLEKNFAMSDRDLDVNYFICARKGEYS